MCGFAQDAVRDNLEQHACPDSRKEAPNQQPEGRGRMQAVGDKCGCLCRQAREAPLMDQQRVGAKSCQVVGEPLMCQSALLSPRPHRSRIIHHLLLSSMQ